MYLDDLAKFNGMHEFKIQRSGNNITIIRNIYYNNALVSTITTTGTVSGTVSVGFVGEQGTMTAVDISALYL